MLTNDSRKATLILTHADIDGICAGAIALSKYPEARVFFTKPVSLYVDLEDVQAERIVIADMAVSKKTAPDVISLLKRKSSGAEIIYFDHHPLPDNVTMEDMRRSVTKFVWDDRMCASELVYRHFSDSMPRERAWLALYGAIGDFTEEGPNAQSMLMNWDKHAVYFEVCSMIMAIKMQKFETYDAKRGMVSSLARGINPTSINGMVECARDSVNREFKLYELVREQARMMGKIGYMKDMPSFGFRGPAALFSATVTNSPIGMYMHTRNNTIDVTIRRRDGGVQLNRLAEYASEKVGGSGGGHPEASGCRIPIGSDGAFLDAANEFLKREA
jgi:RecJ-like exonuclease